MIRGTYLTGLITKKFIRFKSKYVKIELAGLKDSEAFAHKGIIDMIDGYVEKCLLCNCTDFLHRFSKNGFKIVQCKNCNLLFVNPQNSPQETAKIYKEQYFQNRIILGSELDKENKKSIKSFKLKSCKMYLEDISKRVKRGKILDVGCGEGYFLEAAKSDGWIPYGVEISEFAANMARESLGADISCGLLRDVSYPDNMFDLITMLDVVEHFHNPLEEMKEIHRILKPGGMCFLLTPDVESPGARLMRSRWFELKPPEHLFYFSQNTLRQLLESAGFENNSTSTRGKILTFEFIASVMRSTNPLFSLLLRKGLGWTNLYEKNIHFKSGFVVGFGFKK